MYEELSQSIPDISAYLERIGIKERGAAPDLAFLNSLIYHHHTHIPFEDLDSSYLKRPVVLDIPSLFEKIVVNRRGGYCYEMNGLFTRLLLDLGYHARSVFCRIIRGRDFLPPCTHRGIIVDLEGKQYFCDVGYGGPMPAGALIIGDGSEAMYYGEEFQITKYDDYWWTVSRTTSDGSCEKILQFNTFPQIPAEFLAANLKGCTDPDSIFVKKILVNLRTETGSFSLTDHELTIRDRGNTEVLEITGDTGLRSVLKEYFGITGLPEIN